jgi:hypothetical protein
MGLKTEPAPGAYDGPEESFIVYNPTREQMYDLGKKFGQEAVVYSQGGRHEMLYTNGEKDGQYQPSLPTFEYWNGADQGPPENYYTQMPPGGYLRLHFDWDTLKQAPLRIAPKAPQMAQAPVAKSTEGLSRADIATGLLGVLRKSLAGEQPVARPHPHAYEW